MANGVWGRFGAGVFFLCMAFAAPASAERLPPNPLAGGWQVMSSDGSWVSSSCLGEFSSPQCIVETVLACSLYTAEGETTRGRAAIAEDAAWIGGLHPLCDVLRRQPGDAGERDVIYLRGPRAGSLLFYRLLTVDLYYGLLPEGGDRFLSARRGDVAVALHLIDCPPPPGCDPAAQAALPAGEAYAASCLEHCQELHEVQAVIAREQEQGGWRVAGWYLGTPGMDWAFLHGLYEGLWYDLGQ